MREEGVGWREVGGGNGGEFALAKPCENHPGTPGAESECCSVFRYPKHGVKEVQSKPQRGDSHRSVVLFLLYIYLTALVSLQTYSIEQKLRFADGMTCRVFMHQEFNTNIRKQRKMMMPRSFPPVSSESASCTAIIINDTTL